MNPLNLYFMIAAACLTACQIHAALLPAGKCDNRQYNTTNVRIQQLTSQRIWKMTWITDSPELAFIDHGFVEYFTDDLTHNYLAYNEAVLNDNSSITNTCAFKDVGLSYFIEECINDDGSTVIFRDYPFGFIPAKGGLYLRCVERDVPGVTLASNTVMIGVTGHPPLSNAQNWFAGNDNVERESFSTPEGYDLLTSVLEERVEGRRRLNHLAEIKFGLPYEGMKAQAWNRTELCGGVVRDLPHGRTPYHGDTLWNCDVIASRK